MLNLRRVQPVAASALLLLTTLGSASAAQPAIAPQIALVGSPGYQAVAEVELPNGAVIDTYQNGGDTIKAIGRPGATLQLGSATDAKTGRTTQTITFAATRPKTAADAQAYANSGRTVVGDLVALGVDPSLAKQQFSDMETMDPYGPSASAQVASAATGSDAQEYTDAVTASTTVPYDNYCASLNYSSGAIVGQGCSTLFLVAIPSAGDWYFNNKFKMSVQGTQSYNAGCFLTGPGGPTCPYRLFEEAWSIGWSANNNVYDWDPAGTINKGSCTNTTISATYHGFGISVGTTVCPTKIQPWKLSLLSSGTEWTGVEKDNDWEAAIGLQAVHNPPNAAASYSSPMSIQYARWQ
jgi:hypothetical protein